MKEDQSASMNPSGLLKNKLLPKVSHNAYVYVHIWYMA